MGGYQHIPEANKLLQLVNVTEKSRIQGYTSVTVQQNFVFTSENPC